MIPRRAQAELLEWLPRLIVMLVAIIAIALLVRWNTSAEIDAAATHRAAYMARLWYDPGLLTYADPVTKRAYPGMLDAAKLTQNALDTRYGVTGSISSHLTIEAGSCLSKTDIYHDKALFDANLAFAQAGVGGAGSATSEHIALPITVVDGAKRCTGTLDLIIVRPNSPRSQGAFSGGGGASGSAGASSSFGGAS